MDNLGRAAGRLGYTPGLDGLRAVAVTAVFLFHSGVLAGGFIGVDVFFVVSGFLITSLIVSEIERTGGLALGAFWARRARRLLPAIFAVIFAVIAYSAWEGGAALRRVGDDVLATIFYVANWAQLGEGRDYFAQYESEPLLEHAWSLAVEEQFYVVWPLVIAGLLLIVRRAGWSLRSAVAIAAGCVAVASVATAVLLQRSGDTSVTRLYYGTDTRSVGLAVGAMFGALRRPAQISDRSGPSIRRDLRGAFSLGGLLVLCFVLDGSQSWLYGPGFLMIAVLSVVAIDASFGPGRFAQILSTRPAVVVGRLSYGVYLWHWPVIVVLDAERTGLSGLALGATWVAVTAALTTASWVLIESPAPLPSMQHRMRVIGYCGVALLLCGVGVVASRVAVDRQQQASYSIPVLPAPPESNPTSIVPTSTVPTSTVPTSTIVQRETSPERAVALAPSASIALETSTALGTGSTTRPLRVLIIGDSVALSLRDGPDAITQRASFEVAGRGTIDVLNTGVIGCSVVEQGGWSFDGIVTPQPEECRGDDRFAPDVERFDPDVILTLFGWPGTGERRFDDGTVTSACDERFDQVWSRDYQRLVDRLETSAVVVVANVAPLFGATAELQRGTRCLNAQVAGLDASVVDVQGWLCPEYDCTVSASLRPDGLHFRTAGQLQRDVTAALLELVLPVAGY